jgi:hypothetical protein
LVNDLVERHQQKRMQDLEVLLSEVTRAAVSTQEADFSVHSILGCDLGKYFQALLALIEKVPELPPQHRGVVKKVKNCIENLKEKLISKVPSKRLSKNRLWGTTRSFCSSSPKKNRMCSDSNTKEGNSPSL